MEPQCKTDQEAPNIHSESVKEEFYKWFENRGLLSELRAHMRQLMVKALDESNTNNKSGTQKKAVTSPKLQAINLLLVDYLFHEDYLYTVSVFASEAHILESLPQYSRYVSETVRQHRLDPSCLPRFSRQETEDILDTLRLPPSRCDMDEAVQLYLSGQESLLTCVTRTLASHHTISPENNTNMEWAVPGGHRLWSKEMQNLLLMAGVKLQHIQRMQHKWFCVIEDEKWKTRKECEKDQLIQWAEREERLREEVRKEINEQQNRLQEREQELNELAGQLSEVHQDVSQRLAQLQEQSENLQERESMLKEREMHQEIERKFLEQKLNNIEVREEHLKLTMASLTKQTIEASTQHLEAVPAQLQQEPVITSDASVQACECAIPGPQVEPASLPGPQVEAASLPGPQVEPALLPGPQVVCANTQTVTTVDHEQQTSSSFEMDPQMQLRLQTEQEKINDLLEENMELRAYALQQRQRIDELTNRAASLSTQLEESQVALTLLNGRGSDQPVPMPVAIPALPSPQNVFVAPTFGFNNPQRQGAGEESLFTPRSQQATSRADGRRRPSRFAFSTNPNPHSEESSPTDEVVENARARIQQLEAESVAVQRSYQAFQARLFNSDSVMFPPLIESPRIGDPLLRVRRADVSPSVPRSARHQTFTFNTNNYRQQERHVHSPEEDNDSSSDQSLFYNSGRFENFASSRRFFTERHIRHYERWKQFKKKFQRRNNFDRQNNTSSDDDDSFRRPRKKNEINKLKPDKNHDTLDIKEPDEYDALNIMRNTTEFTENHNELPRKENQSDHQNLPVLTPKEEESHAKIKSVMLLEDNIREDKIKSEIEKSMKFIESVKVLLQNSVNNPAPRTLSNESLMIESLPKDSDDSIQNEKSLAENYSAITVKRIDLNIQEITEEKHNEKGRESSLVADNICQSQEDVDQGKFFVSKTQQKDPEIELEEERENFGEHCPLSLEVPNLRLTSPAIGEDRSTLIEVADQDGGDKETASITSASDILRELNESSDNQVSVSNDSHSEDFWN